MGSVGEGPGGRGTHIGKRCGDVPQSWPPFFRLVGAPDGQSQDANFPNFHSQDPTFFKENPLLIDPTFGNPCGTYPDQKSWVPPGEGQSLTPFWDQLPSTTYPGGIQDYRGGGVAEGVSLEVPSDWNRRNWASTWAEPGRGWGGGGERESERGGDILNFPILMYKLKISSPCQGINRLCMYSPYNLLTTGSLNDIHSPTHPPTHRGS